MSDTMQKLDAISKEMSRLRNERDTLYVIWARETQEKLRPLIGLCVKHNEWYYKIIDVPIIHAQKTGFKFNQYQLPCLKVKIKDIDDESYSENGLDILDYDTLFSQACEYDDPMAYFIKYNKRSLITMEEFDAALEKVFDRIRILGKRGDAK